MVGNTPLVRIASLCELTGCEILVRLDAMIETGTTPLIRWIYGKRTLAEMEAAGGFAVTGDRAAAERFAAVFALPAKLRPEAAPASFCDDR